MALITIDVDDSVLSVFQYKQYEFIRTTDAYFAYGASCNEKGVFKDPRLDLELLTSMLEARDEFKNFLSTLYTGIFNIR